MSVKINKFMTLVTKKSLAKVAGKTSIALILINGLITDAHAGLSFTFLESGFTQELYGVSPNFLGGIAFAADGDVWATTCTSSGSPLVRFDSQTLLPAVNGTATLHPSTTVESNGGCGLTNGPDGFLYSNTDLGIVQIDADTGINTGLVFGNPGNSLGIAVDPLNNNFIHASVDGTIYTTPFNGTSTQLSTASVGNLIDGIFFDPTGQFIFLANRDAKALTILRRDGTLVQNIGLTSEPDGVAFHNAPNFVVTGNTDGTMNKLVFPNDDYTVTPTITLFASGGFRGDLMQVGSDSCLYLTQDGARYDDGTVPADLVQNSVVKICSGFVPPNPPKTPTCSDTPPPEAIVGTEGDDVIKGTAGNDIIYGLAGKDKIYGYEGDDLICAGPDDDYVEDGPGKDTVVGDTGDDLIKTQDTPTNADNVDGGPHKKGDTCLTDSIDTVINCEFNKVPKDPEECHKVVDKWHYTSWLNWDDDDDHDKHGYSKYGKTNSVNHDDDHHDYDHDGDDHEHEYHDDVKCDDDHHDYNHYDDDDHHDYNHDEDDDHHSYYHDGDDDHHNGDHHGYKYEKNWGWKNWGWFSRY